MKKEVSVMPMNAIAQKNHDELFPGIVAGLNETDPEFIEAVDNFTFDEVIAHTNFDVKARLKVMLPAMIAQNNFNQFKMFANAAISVGVDPIEIKEIVYQTLPYVGQWKGFELFGLVNQVFEACGIPVEPERRSQVTPETRFEQGLAVARQVVGEDVDVMLASVPENQKHLAQFVATNAYADYFVRAGLSPQDRTLTIFVVLATIGGAEQQLKRYIKANITVGNTKQTLVDVLTVILPFIGYPRLLTALNLVNEVLPEV